MPLPIPQNPDNFRRLVEIMDCLLAPEGCPWDREQTHASLKPYAIEETYEVVDAIDRGDMKDLCGELGDLGLQVVFHAALAKRAGNFTIDDVYGAICAKLIRRHPHVFGDVNAADAGTVLRNWEQIKKAERAEEKKKTGVLSGLPTALPALQRAFRLQAKAANVGFDWGAVGPVLEKIREELAEFEAELAPQAEAIGAPVTGKAPKLSAAQKEKIAGELGDLLFAITNLARFLEVDPEQALQSTNRKFQRRFEFIEEKLAAQGRDPKDSNLEEMDGLWNAAKQQGL